MGAPYGTEQKNENGSNEYLDSAMELHRAIIALADRSGMEDPMDFMENPPATDSRPKVWGTGERVGNFESMMEQGISSAPAVGESIRLFVR